MTAKNARTSEMSLTPTKSIPISDIDPQVVPTPLGKDLPLRRRTQDLRSWQEGLVTVFEQAVLPATQHLFHLVRSYQDADCEPNDSLESKLEEYYQSITRPKLHENEIVWDPEERKIETLLLSPPIRGNRFLRAQYQAATGAGKTRSMVELVRMHMDSNVRVDSNKCPLYVVVEPTLQLVKQTYDALKQIDGLDCVCVCSDTSVPSKAKRDIPSYVQSRKKPTLIITTKNSSAGTNQPEGMDGNGLLDIFSKHGIIAELLLLDESHLLAGEAMNKIQKETFVKNSATAMLKISFTATPSALNLPQEKSNGFHAYFGDGDETFFCQNNVDGVFGPVMYRYSYGDALQDDVVVPLQLRLMDNSLPKGGQLLEFVQDCLDGWDKNNLATGEWPRYEGNRCIDPLDATTEKQRPFEKTLWRSERLLMVLHIVHEVAIGNQTHVLAFCSERKQRAKKLQSLVGFVCRKMIESITTGRSLFSIQEGSIEHQRLSTLYQSCYCDVSGASGNNVVEAFKKSEIGFLSNVDRISVGSDIHQVTGIWFPDIKGKSNPQQLIQCIGRGTRTTERKKSCVIFLPCFVQNATLTLEKDEGTRKALGELGDKASRNNWEGTFSKMALHLFDFFKQNQFDGHQLKIECIQSRNLINNPAIAILPQTEPQSINADKNEHSGYSFVIPRPSSASVRFRHGGSQRS